MSAINDNTDVMEEENLSTSKESIGTPSNVGFTFKPRVELRRLDSDDPPRINDESSVGSEIVSELIKSAEQSSFNKSEKSIADGQITPKNGVALLHVVNDETTIEEASRISGERSEIVSELFHATDKSIPTNQSQSKSSSNAVQKVQYESDTFENASSSTGSSSSAEEQLKTSEEEVAQGTIRSGVKQIDHAAQTNRSSRPETYAR